MFRDRDDAARQLCGELSAYGAENTVEVGLARCGVVLAYRIARTLCQLDPLVERLICLQSPEFFHAVGQFYSQFAQVTDEDVIALPRQFNS